MPAIDLDLVTAVGDQLADEWVVGVVHGCSFWVCPQVGRMMAFWIASREALAVAGADGSPREVLRRA